ncbi:hypothetical protein R1sor_005612 [Riccia sorocarpa]|uniref:Uncharacterized protein n=1 Tax=Riccia sorocarpa TaxID=122646 RepID=A0ABD3HPC1_9MARC
MDAVQRAALLQTPTNPTRPYVVDPGGASRLSPRVNDSQNRSRSASPPGQRVLTSPKQPAASGEVDTTSQAGDQFMDTVLAGGPYYMRRRMVYTVPWEPGFDTKKTLAKHLACWLDLLDVDPMLEGEGPNLLASLGKSCERPG